MAEPNRRLNAAEKALLLRWPWISKQYAREMAKEALAAALDVDDLPKPKWPTNESVVAYFGATENEWLESRYDESHRKRLGAAFLADPIIRAAVPLVKSWETNYYRDSMTADAKALRRAVKEAGLLDD